MVDVLEKLIENCEFVKAGRDKLLANNFRSVDKKDYHIIGYVTQGWGYYITKDKTYTLKPGDLVYFPPYSEAKITVKNDVTLINLWVAFKLDEQGYLQRKVFTNEGCIVENCCSIEIRELFDKSLESYLGCKNNLIKKGVLLQLLGELFTPEQKDEVNSFKSSHVTVAINFMKNNYDKKITVNDIASCVGVTPNYLSNIFNEVVGKSTKEYLIDIRMEHACEMLKQRKYKIKTISAKVGYSNQLHFSNEFKRVMGVSPKNYK